MKGWGCGKMCTFCYNPILLSYRKMLLCCDFSTAKVYVVDKNI